MTHNASLCGIGCKIQRLRNHVELQSCGLCVRTPYGVSNMSLNFVLELIVCAGAITQTAWNTLFYTKCGAYWSAAWFASSMLLPDGSDMNGARHGGYSWYLCFVLTKLVLYSSFSHSSMYLVMLHLFYYTVISMLFVDLAGMGNSRVKWFAKRILLFAHN